MTPASEENRLLVFVGGRVGALAPLVLFLAGVAWLGLSGAPDERGFWPVLLAAISLGMLLVRDRHAYAETMLAGMSRPIVMLMILAWLLAGVLAKLLGASGFVESLVWLAEAAGVEGRGFVVASFLISCIVSTATGTSLGTLILITPLLYPTGGALGAEPTVLLGAILGGATFGDNISPVSDTTIASATTQGADLGGVVLSRLRYALPAAALALVAYALLGARAATARDVAARGLTSDASGLPMLLAPAFVLVLLLRRCHLVEALLFGILTAAAVGLACGLLETKALLFIDAENFTARGLVVDGIERGLGVSIFTLLLMALVSGLEASGLVERMIEAAQRHSQTARGAELATFGATSAATVLTTHSVVAILTVGDLARRTGERFALSAYRRANLLDITVCTYPFLLPFCIPTILISAQSSSGRDFDMPQVSAFAAGMSNFHSWALLLVLLFAILTGFGRSSSTEP